MAKSYKITWPSGHTDSVLRHRVNAFNVTQRVRAAWFDVSLNDSPFIPILASNGFEFHHSKNSKEVTMIKWIPDDELSQVRTQKASLKLDCFRWQIKYFYVVKGSRFFFNRFSDLPMVFNIRALLVTSCLQLIDCILEACILLAGVRVYRHRWPQ